MICLQIAIFAFLSADLPYQEKDPTIDGNLDEPQWTRARVVENFRMRYPAEEDRHPSYSTTAYLYHTKRGLYVGFLCQQPKTEQIARLYARDASGQGDKVFVNLDVEGTAQRGYYFLIGSSGHMEDGTIRGEKSFSTNWDGPWQAAARREANSWTAECFFPWDMFPGIARDPEGQYVRVFLSRWVEAIREEYSWPRILDNDSRHLSLFQKVGIADAIQSKGLWISPYASAAALLEQETETERAGLDLNWRPNERFGLTLTANPDFGQVESDDIVINLGAFETFFEEKRPFFLKEQEFFESNRLPFFYSRRIGAGRNGGTGDLKAALKATGSFGNTSYGVIAAHVDFAEPSGIDSGQANYSLVTLKRESRSTTLRQALTPSFASTENYQGLNLEYSLETNDGKIALQSQLVHTKNSDIRGLGGSSKLTWIPQRGLRHSLEATILDPDVDFNPLGFMRRNDEQTMVYTLVKEWIEIPKVQFLSLRNELVYGENFDGLAQAKVARFTGFASMENGQQWTLSYRHEGPVFDDRISRGAGPVAYETSYNTWAAWRSDVRKKVGIRFYYSRHREPLGGDGSTGQIQLFLHPVSNLNLHLVSGQTRRSGFLFWERDSRFSFHDLDENASSLRLSWVIDPKQELRTIFQFSSFKSELLREVALTEDKTGVLMPIDPTGAGDLNINRLSFQVRYRYEIQPLSNLFVVYARGGRFFDRQARLSFSDSWKHPDDLSLLVKVNYLFK